MQHTPPPRWPTQLEKPPRPIATRVPLHTTSAKRRHSFGTELATAGVDLLVLRALMGHASPETTAGYVHLSFATLAAEYAKARAGAP